MQDATQATVRRLGLVGVVLSMALAALAATAGGASAATVTSTSGPLVQLDVIGTPATVSPSTAGNPTFVSYAVTITNRAQSTLTHLSLNDSITGGSTLVPGTPVPSSGTCTVGVGQVNCALGSLPSGGTATVTILVQTPQIVGPGPVTIANAATASYDEAFNDTPALDPKQDTLSTTEQTAVAAVAGTAASLVPSNADVQIDTDPTHVDVASPQDQNIGKAHVPASDHPPVTASLDEVTAPFTCPRKQICRNGAWVHADIGNGLAFTPALQFELHWSQLLVPKQQTVKNLAVLHTACLDGCPIEIVSSRCSSPNPAPTELPCLSDVVETASEFKATLHSKTNGYMR